MVIIKHIDAFCQNIYEVNDLKKHKRRLRELEGPELGFEEISVGSLKVLKEVWVD